MVKKLDIILPLFMGIIIWAISFFQKDSLNSMVLKLIITLLVFYVIGFIIRLMIEKVYSSTKHDHDPNADENHDPKEVLDEDLTQN
ncbi:MAG: hypothetical protein PWP07_399 [Epulopiscium sp.]|jgi:phosphotransferase system  glucose/maltose/N-acetylglucosamine-specific IIC component|uniref:Uncharacterized protein n=1 Tax=Defluviitalea raffinosedens TaxID=1450156 RepID=A0A7C8LMD3_9FIRM|nr:hypothetical protein [Defluviitalea raffinosedens]MBZ4669259.1 hypothetical protein [Defluviitaleaceae bacterium]MDK2787174.1 hypothetical protein [Candidatus Epulonipiscium sp.]KAE9637063.1 hypothetical protein GND95_01120 [Defluviitalea raffinosedens]MBM7685180.1 phosphotransferase system glucose/maltose/N-acetylglucosamine-specific IIC component [Defluviitalea raffinosedens]HHW67381.1 hypothetical protein [Candidatus Epulonipiscium sp.]